MGVDRICGDWSVLAEAQLSQSNACKATKNDLFDHCCYRECNLCKDAAHSIDWNHQLSYEGLASTCLDVYMNLHSEKVQDGDDRCQSIQFTVSQECCHKLPTNQCSLCQSSDGTFLNTNWNNVVSYQGEKVTCSDVNAMLSSEELDSILCLSARDDLWIQCCTPQQGGNTGLGGILPTLAPKVSDRNPTNSMGSTESSTHEDGEFQGSSFYRRNNASYAHSFNVLALLGMR